MKVLVLSTKVPFVHGGAEELFDHLVRNLNSVAGIQAEGMRLPFTWEPAERLIDEMLIARRIRLTNVDRVIALKFPAYLIPWHNKTMWLVHQYRQAYDLLELGQSNIPDSDRGRGVISAIRAADHVAFAEARRIFSISPVVAQRLKHFCQIDSTSMRAPLNDPELFVGAESEGYILATGRVNASKRQHLLVKALRYAPRVRLIVAGPADSAADELALRMTAKAEGVSDRLTLDIRFLQRDELAALVNKAAAVAYLPFQEDSYGYCTMEAFQAAKPVITVTDSGGVLDIVKDGVTGLIVSPEPELLGNAMSKLVSNTALSRRLGIAGRQAMIDQELNWSATVKKLLS